MTNVRNNALRVNRKDVISSNEFKELQANADAIEDTFMRLRSQALLAVLMLTGKRRSEVARLELSDFTSKEGYLHIRFQLSKKRRETVISKVSTKSIPLTDELTLPILQYISHLQGLEPMPRYFLPPIRVIFGGSRMIINDKHLSGRQILNLIHGVSESCWVHLFRESAAAAIVRADPSLISAFRVQQRLDLESMLTGFNYLRRYAGDIITREAAKENQGEVSHAQEA